MKLIVGSDENFSENGAVFDDYLQKMSQFPFNFPVFNRHCFICEIALFRKVVSPWIVRKKSLYRFISTHYVLISRSICSVEGRVLFGRKTVVPR